MDAAAKKRKSDENGAVAAHLTPDDAAKIIDSFTHDQLLDIVKSAMSRADSAVLDAVRAIADSDPAQRKIFIRGLGWDTTNDSLRAVFAPFGEIEEAVVITDKATGRSKGYGFVTFRHIDGAIIALKEPSKKIDSRVAVASLASAGPNAAGGAGTGIPAPSADTSQRKIYIGNVPADMPSDRLLQHFAMYGEIEEGPLGYDKQTGKFRGFALFVYKTVEAAQASLVDPTKNVDGHHLVCKLANDPKKGKPGAPLGQAAGTDIGGGGGDGRVSGTQSSLYGGPTFPGYAGTAIPAAAGLSHHHALNSSIGMGTPGMPSLGAGGYGGGLPSAGSQVPSLGAGGYGGGQVPPLAAGVYGGGLGAYGGSAQYGAGAGAAAGVPGSGGYAGFGVGSSLYRMQPGSAAMPSGGYPESGQYSLSSSGYQSQQHHSAGSPGRRYPTGGVVYPSLPPYY